MNRLSAVLLWALAGFSVHAAEGLLLRIQHPGQEGRSRGSYVGGTRIPMQLEISNSGDDRASVTIVEHDLNGNREAYPDGLQIRVVDGRGRVLTAHMLNLGAEQQEWWHLRCRKGGRRRAIGLTSNLARRYVASTTPEGRTDQPSNSTAQLPDRPATFATFRYE